MQIQLAVWHRNPVFRFLPPLLLGIFAGEYFQLPFPLLFISFSLASLTLSLFEFIPLNHKYRFYFIAGIAVHILLFSAGNILVQQHKKKSLLTSIEKQLALVLITTTPEKGTNRWKMEGEIQFKKTKRSERILVYSDTNFFKCGDLVLINKNLEPIPYPGNPGSFNYREYCRKKGITAQAYLGQNDFVLLKQSIQSPVTAFINECRKRILGLLQNNLKTGEELGLAEALLIGYKGNLDRELLQSYSKTGVVHVIAISGLHLGLIYILLLLLTKPLQKFPLVRLTLILIALWTFSLIAGAGPSVLRSAIMFSFLALGTGTKRKGPVLNTLALSALLLILFKPYILWDAGFQLSYSAVLGILLFYRPIFASLHFQNKILLQLWNLTALTISAQVFTTPLTLFLFNKFPLLFLYANGVTVPLSSLLLFGLLLFLPLSFVPFLTKPLASLIMYGIRLMNDFVRIIENHPLASWEPLQISLVQALLLGISILLFAGGILFRKKLALLTAPAFLLIFMVSRLCAHYYSSTQHLLIVYSIPKQTCVDYIRGKTTLFIGIEPKDPFSKDALAASRRLHRIEALQSFSGSVFTKDSSIGRLNKQGDFPHSIKYLVISKGAKSYDLVHLPRHVILDGSLSYKERKAWTEWCSNRKIPLHDVVEKGAFIVHLGTIPLRFP